MKKSHRKLTPALVGALLKDAKEDGRTLFTESGSLLKDEKTGEPWSTNQHMMIKQRLYSLIFERARQADAKELLEDQAKKLGYSITRITLKKSG